MALAEQSVDFVLCGGLACVLHGSSRHTRDVDIAVRLNAENLRRLIAAAKKLKLQPRIPEPLESLLDDKRRLAWIREKNAMVYTLVSTANELQIDVFLAYPIDYETLVKNADSYDVNGRLIRVSCKRDLIIAKRTVQPPRIEDEFDIRFLEDRIQREQ